MIKNKYGAFVKKCREQKGYSQQQMAELLGIGRTSYIGIEQDKREISLDEAQRLAGILDITINDILGGLSPNLDKYKDMIITFLQLYKKDGSDGKVPKTKLAKLIYLADFAWYYNNLESMSGMQYKKLQYGPVADPYFRVLDELFESGEINIEAKNDTILVSVGRGAENRQSGSLSKDEVKLINQINKKWKDKRTKEIVDFTHSQMPWRFGLDGETVHYELITQEDPDHVY